MSHRIKATDFILGALRKKRPHGKVGPAPPKWPSYTGTSEFVGTSPSGRVTLYVDPTLGNSALQNAQDLIDDAARVVSANDVLVRTCS